MPDVPAAAEPVAPSLTVSKLRFSDGTTLEVLNNDVIVLVGPNNSGKSAALRQIENNLAEPNTYNVIKSCSANKLGTNRDFISYLKSQSQQIYKHGELRYVGYKYEFRAALLPDFLDSKSSDIRDFFVLRCSTDDRLNGSNPVRSISYRKEQPSHPIHLLVMDRELERRIGAHFNEAFGKSLYVNRAEGSEVSLYVGDDAVNEIPQDAFSAEAKEFFASKAHSLHSQGDGMRAFATVALNTAAISQQTVLMIDEPEAFLHPPQARMLGRLISSGGSRERQTFVATHSSDVLKGILEGSTRRVHILRITRSNDINHISKLDPKIATEMVADPLVRFSGIFDGIFFRHVVLCESDTDCQFYGSLLDVPDVYGTVRPDALFVQSSGKHRMVKLGKVAKQLGIPFSTIVDIDVLNERTLFKSLADVAGIDWNKIDRLWRDVTDSINAQRVRLTPVQLLASIDESVAKLRRSEISVLDFLTEIRDRIKSNSPWDAVKRGGRNALPMGATVQKFDELLQICGEHGLWVVPVGELEGFCRSIESRKGGEWIASLMENHDLRISPELAEARAFVAQIWHRAEEA